MNHLLKKVFFYLFLLSFLSGNNFAADEEKKDPSPTTKPSGNIKAYYELRGKQVERCINDATFSQGGKIRWVNNLNLLWCSKTISNYGPLVDEEQEWRRDKSRDIPGTAIHEKLAHIGSSLKVLNGYYGDKGNNDPLDGITPDSTNFLVPYISFVVKEEGGPPHFQPGGYFCRSDKDTAVVFVSGSGKNTDKSALEAGFNLVIRNAEKEPNILILSGGDIDKSLTEDGLREGLRKAYLDPGSFVFSEAHKRVFYDEFVKKLLGMYRDLTDNVSLQNIQLNIESMYWVAKVLSNINNNKNFPEPEIQSYIITLNNSNLLYNDLRVFIEDLTDSQKSSDITRALAMHICNIYTGIKSLNYEKINQIRGFITATYFLENPQEVIESTDKIDVLQQLPSYLLNRKDINGYYRTLVKTKWLFSPDHTEPFLVSYAKIYPEIILNLLRELKTRNDAKKIALKAIILDVHSWLDMCGNCQSQFFDQWEALIHSLQSEIDNLGFILPKDKPKVLIRMSSEKHYEYAPKDLSSAGGGINILSKGFDAKAFASTKFILATRRNGAEKNYRDKLIEEIWEKHLETCLYQPYEFWLANPIVFSNIIMLSNSRPIGRDMLVLLAQRHPQEKAFTLAAAIGMINPDRGYQLQKLEVICKLLKPILENPQNYINTDKLLTCLKSHHYIQLSAVENPSFMQDYARVFYGRSCIKLLERKINGVSYVTMNNLLSEFLNYGLMTPLQSGYGQDIIVPTEQQIRVFLLLKQCFPFPVYNKIFSLYHRDIIAQTIMTVIYQGKSCVSSDTPEGYEKENLRLLRELMKK